MELIEQDGCLWDVGLGGVAKRLPHVHHRQANTAALVRSEPGIKLTHTGLRAVLAAKPDGSATNEIADHDAVGVPLSDRDFINANHLRSWLARLGKLRSHVLLIELLDRVPVELELLGDVLDRGRATAPPYVIGKALGIKRVVGQKLQSLDRRFHPLSLCLYPFKRATALCLLSAFSFDHSSLS